jgi:hypothetical protein
MNVNYSKYNIWLQSKAESRKREGVLSRSEAERVAWKQVEEGILASPILT